MAVQTQYVYMLAACTYECGRVHVFATGKRHMNKNQVEGDIKCGT